MMLNDRRFKLVVLGTTGVGKTCLTLRFVKGLFDEEQLPTIGAAYMTKKIHLPSSSNSTNTDVTKSQSGGKDELTVEIWDTAGQERYESITPLYYRSAEAAIIAFDLTNKHSFNKARDWLARLRKERPDPNMPIALAGNKADLKAKVEAARKAQGADGKKKTDDDFDLVSDEEIKAFVDENKLKFFKTSAKTGENIDEMFLWLAANLPKSKDDKSSAAVSVSENAPHVNAGCC